MSLFEPISPGTPSERQSIGDAAFQKLARHLLDETGIVLSEAKKGLAVSRLSRRLRVLGLSNFDDYCSILEGANGTAELQEMILLLTTNVTRFFREPHHFENLRTAILPTLLEKAKSGGRIRIWSAGCSSGEEPYSIAMAILEKFPQAATSNIRILASDIDQNMIGLGQAGRYRITAEDHTIHPLLAKYTDRVPGATDTVDIVPAAKALVQFAKLNLQQPWPMRGKFDVIFCRNVVIYFSTETQQALWPRFADALQEGGHLMIGHSERVTGPAAHRLRSSGVTQYQLSDQGVMR